MSTEAPVGDRAAARDALITSHTALARSLARRFANRGESLDDLVQVAMIGLIKAADRFDARFDIRFSTYATATISGELKRHFRDQRWGVHVTRTAQERYLLVREATEWATADMGRSPTVGEVALRAGVSDEQVIEAHELASAFEVDSLDRHDEGGADDPRATPAVLGLTELGFGHIDDRVTLGAVTARLTKRERQLIHLRFVEDLTQSEIAARLGLSQMQVSRLLARTLASLRSALSDGIVG